MFVQLLLRNLKSVHEVLLLASASAVKQQTRTRFSYFHTWLEKFTQE